MNYEERFKEVLAKAQEAITYLPDPALKTWLESVFPELKKSSFEDIRKTIIHIVNVSKETHFGIDNYDGVKWDEMLAWLDKPVEEINGKDYGIDGLWHAKDILERTLGKVDGYQTDDGILEHKAAIDAVKKLYNQDSAGWKPSELQIQCLSDAVNNYHKQGYPAEVLTSLLNDLKNL